MSFNNLPIPPHENVLLNKIINYISSALIRLHKKKQQDSNKTKEQKHNIETNTQHHNTEINQQNHSPHLTNQSLSQQTSTPNHAIVGLSSKTPKIIGLKETRKQYVCRDSDGDSSSEKYNDNNNKDVGINTNSNINNNTATNYIIPTTNSNKSKGGVVYV